MKINYRQMSVMLFLSFIAMKFLILPSSLFLKSGNSSWFVVLVLMLLDGLYALLIINLMRKNQDKNILEFMNATIGKFLTKIFLLVLAIQYFFQLLNIVKGLEFFVTENFYYNFNWILFSLPLVALVGFMMYKGLRNIARVQEIFYLSIIVGCIYIAFKSFADVDKMVYMPFFKVGFMPLVNGAFSHMNWFGSSTFLLAIFGKVDFSNARKRTSILYIIFAIMLVQLVHFVFYGLFDITSPTHTFAISDISQFSSSKSIIDELSWLVVSLWVITQSIQIALFGYCLIKVLMYLFNFKSKITMIFLVDLAIFGMGYIGAQTVNIEKVFFMPFVSTITIIAQYIIPLVLLAGYLVNKRKTNRENLVEVNNEKVKNNI